MILLLVKFYLKYLSRYMWISFCPSFLLFQTFHLKSLMVFLPEDYILGEFIRVLKIFLPESICFAFLLKGCFGGYILKFCYFQRVKHGITFCCLLISYWRENNYPLPFKLLSCLPVLLRWLLFLVSCLFTDII